MRRYSNLMFFVIFEYQYKQNFDLYIQTNIALGTYMIFGNVRYSQNLHPKLTPNNVTE